MAIPQRRRRPSRQGPQLQPETYSSRSLDALFDSEAENDRRVIDALYARGIHPVNLWKYRKRRRRPDLDTAILIEEVTKGRVPVLGWKLPRDKAA